jgi:pyruvate formate lyase activating enzyme
VAKEMGRDTPLHFSRFHGDYKMKNLPETPAETLSRAKRIAEAEGLKHVYIGNILVENSGNTYCPSCRKLLVGRRGYLILENNMKDGACPACRTKVYGRWN